jgi:hypothetical protein
MKSRLFILILAALALPASATEWQLISETKEPGKIISWYVDMSSIVHEDDYMRAFLRTSWSTPQYAPDDTVYQSSTYINYFNCDTHSIAFTGNVYYRSEEPVGKPVHEEPKEALDKLRFQQVKPGSAGDARVEFVCKFRSKNFMTRRSIVDEQG